MSSPRPHRPVPPRVAWWATFALLALAGAAWSLATPRLSGADESDHAIRAAAVVRGQPVGGATSELLGSRNVFIDVEVPEAYGSARSSATCFIDYADSPAATPFDALGPPPECTPLEGGRRRVTTTTLQYRGQPSYYAVVGLPTLLWPDGTGIAAMRLVSAALTAALLASALAAARAVGSRRLAVAVLAGATPVCLWLSGQVNTGGFEVAAAALVWAAGLVVARAPVVTGRDVTRLGAGLALLTVVRGLSPAYAAGAVVVLAVLAGRPRLRELAARRDVRWWGLVVSIAWVASVAWLAYIQLRYPLDPRPGSGLDHALGEWSWYVRQTVGVFGVNDVVTPWPPVVAWWLVVAGLVAVGLRRATAVERAVVVLLGVGGYAMNFTAEGMSLPPIGYFWQGRYVLPALVGVAILASGLEIGRPDEPEPSPSRGANDVVPLAVGAAVLVAVHGWAFAHVARHMAGQGTTLGYLDALRDPVWRAPLLPSWAWLAVYVLALAATAAVALLPPPAAPSSGQAGPAPTVGARGSDGDPI
ncbi:MAG TPA: DUF2142 domain-containing protein [Acidimicrobiales bacterium]|nr:DUF2142 domain-containing protein [Acidimicrobiales bacterium]